MLAEVANEKRRKSIDRIDRSSLGIGDRVGRGKVSPEDIGAGVNQVNDRGHPRAELLIELDRPVRLVEKVSPHVRKLSPLEPVKRVPPGSNRLAGQLDPAFSRQAIPFMYVAPEASAHDVLPG